MAYDEKTAERVRRVLAKRRDVVERKMMGGLSFIIAGGMCCSVSGHGGLLVRVAPEDRNKIMAEPHVAPMAMGGRKMTGFARVHPDGYKSDAALRRWIGRGIDAVAALPPKKKPMSHKK